MKQCDILIELCRMESRVNEWLQVEFGDDWCLIAVKFSYIGWYLQPWRIVVTDRFGDQKLYRGAEPADAVTKILKSKLFDRIALDFDSWKTWWLEPATIKEMP